MGTQTKEVSCYERITSRQDVAKDIEEDKDGMGTKDEQLRQGLMPITTNTCTTQKSSHTRTYLEEGDSESHTLKGRTTRTYSERQRKGKNHRCYKHSIIITIYVFFSKDANNHMGD